MTKTDLIKKAMALVDEAKESKDTESLDTINLLEHIILVADANREYNIVDDVIGICKSELRIAYADEIPLQLELKEV